MGNIAGHIFCNNIMLIYLLSIRINNVLQFHISVVNCLEWRSRLVWACSIYVCYR